jgi:hypothetical protein
MIKWIAHVLRNEGDQLSDYSIEYATALLMNLSLRAAGKDKCEDPNIELLKVLNDLVEHDNLQVRTYVNGTLYSIFTRKKLREEAKELGMPEVLQYLMQQSDEQFKRQIQYILDQLNNQGVATDAEGQQQQPEEDFDDEEDDDDDDEEEDEEDIVEEEEGEFNDIIDEQGILVGEDLLVNDYIASPEEGMQQLRAVQMLMDRDRQRRMQNNGGETNQGLHSPYSGASRSQVSAHDGRPLMRPITPLKSSQAMRQLQQSTNTSALTNNQFVNGQMGENMGTQPFPNEENTDRNLPSEMKHRPKIPRTPNKTERGHNEGQNPNNQSNLGLSESIGKLPQVTKNGKPLNVRL